MAVSRRGFLGGAVAVAASVSTRFSFGMPLGLKPGIQLYSVRKQMAEDFEGALAAVREAGFLEVESAALPKKSASELRAALDKAGLKCVSSHRSFVDLTTKLDEVAAFEKTIGVSYIICPGPGRRNPPAAGTKPGPITIDDWQYNAEEFNKIGAKLKQKFRDPRGQSVFVRCDENVPFGAFATVMDAVKSTGITNVSIVTQPLK